MQPEASASAADLCPNMDRRPIVAMVEGKRLPLRRIATAKDTPKPRMSTKMANGLDTLPDAAIPGFTLTAPGNMDTLKELARVTSGDCEVVVQTASDSAHISSASPRSTWLT